MPKKIKLPDEVLDACQVFDDYGASKKDVAKALKIHPTTLDRRIKEREAAELRQENERLRTENAGLKASKANEDNIINFVQKQA